MKRLFCRVLLFAVMFIPVASSRGTENPNLSWDSPKVLEVKKELAALRADLHRVVYEGQL